MVDDDRAMYGASIPTAVAGLILGLHPASERRRCNDVSHRLGASLEAVLNGIDLSIPEFSIFVTRRIMYAIMYVYKPYA